MKILLIMIASLEFGQALAQGIFKTIPDSAITASNSIMHYDNTEFIIEHPDKSKMIRNYEVVVLNKHATEKKNILLHYNKFSAIKNASVDLLSLDGKVIKKYKLKNFQDWSADGSSIASDSRARYLNITYDHYPFRLQVAYEIDYKGSLLYPKWRPQDNENQFVLNASFKIINKSGEIFRYNTVNIGEPEKWTENGAEVYEWQVKNIFPVQYEPFNYYADNYFPTVYTAPNKFVMDNYEGDMSTWRDFGQWINKLNEGKNNLSQAQLSEIKNIINENDTGLEKVKKVYRYLQLKTRYVSIQLGIGGWQPFDAAFVHEKKYGDCKALSFYTKSLLEAVGVQSYYTLIRAGSYQPEIMDDFPNAHFNHVILSVPIGQDTVWLECTSQTNPFGYLGTFTSGRKALLINEEGGHVIKIKEYNEAENEQRTTGTILLNGDGSAKASVIRKYTAIQLSNDNFQRMLLKPSSEQDQWFYDELEWGTFKVLNYKINDVTEDIIPSAGFSANIELTNAGASAGNRLFFKPSVFTDIDHIKLNQETRKKDILIKYAYSHTDSLTITPPEHFHLENNLNDHELNTPYGTYSRQVIENKEGKFLYIRRFVLKKGVYPAEDFPQFREFVRNVQKFDRQKLVFVNKT